jgi:hypothetical protein
MHKEGQKGHTCKKIVTGKLEEYSVNKEGVPRRKANQRAFSN